MEEYIREEPEIRAAAPVKSRQLRDMEFLTRCLVTMTFSCRDFTGAGAQVEEESLATVKSRQLNLLVFNPAKITDSNTAKILWVQ